MALTEIEYGSLASSEIMNNNFQYLDNRISSVSETVSTNQAGVNSNIASINSTLTSMSEEIDADIEEINKSLEETIAKFSENGIFTTTYVNGTSWYREYFSDEKKETRVWLEQGGLCASRGTATFIKAFRDANYSLATMNTAAFPPKQPAILRTMTARVGAILLNGMLAAFNFRRIKWHLILMKTGI